MSRPQPQLKQLAGILNTDDNNEVMPLVHHKMAKNIVFRGNGNNLRAESVRGNVLIPNNYLPNTGTNECVGSFFDSVKGRIIWFNYNSGGKHGIYQYKFSTGLVSPLLISFTNSVSDIFNFDLNYPIASVNIIYASDDIGDTLLWLGRNKRPMKLNLKDAEANLYGSNWLEDYLTVARPMPLIAPVCAYADDNTVNINNLRKKLYEFRYRWVYKDFTKSTWSPYSKLFAPANPDDIAKNIDEQKDNRIDVTIYTGNADVVKIEIAARQTLNVTFSDNFLVATLDKSKLSLTDNQLYTYKFYNDGGYPTIDLQESNLLFDYVPKLANAQELLNGNVIIYGGITEGNTFSETLDVGVTVSLVDYVANNTNTPLVISVDYLNNTFDTGLAIWEISGQLSLSGTPVEGDVYTITLQSAVFDMSGNPDYTTSVSYTVVAGNTLTNVRDEILSLLQALVQYPTDHGEIEFSSYSTNSITIANIPPDGSVDQLNIINIQYVYASSGNPTDGVSNSIYKHKLRYAFGIVYFDEFGVTNGVVTMASMLIETPELTTTGDSTTQIPKIHIEINSQPPIWATNFSFVRTSNLSVQELLSTVSCSTKKDTDYAYIEITNQQTNQSNFPAYDFTDGDRVRIVGKYGDVVTTVYDFPIQSYKVNPTISGATVTGDFLVIPYDAVLAAFGTAGNDNYLIEIYTPALNSSATQQAYYEFGETYKVINFGTPARAHQGQIQDQIVGTQPSIYEFLRGDFYMKQRKIPFTAALGSYTATWIVDQSVSDLFPSKIVGNGRAFVIDEFARENYFPTLVRWSLAYQQDTSINQTNRFYPLNFDESDRSKGDIQRLVQIDRLLKVIQNRACGQYGVYARFIQNNAGQSQLVTTDDIITANNINYYEGEYGIGDQYTSLVKGKNQIYFVDPVRGYHMRLSGNGLTPLNELYKGQFYIRSLLTPYNSNIVSPNGSKARIVGCYNFFEEECVTVLKGYNPLNIDTNPYAAIGVLVTWFPMAFYGTPIADFKIHFSVTSGITESFDYTIQDGDTIENIVDAIVALVNSTSAVFEAAKQSTTTVFISKILVGGAMTGSVVMTWQGSNNAPIETSNTFSFNEKRNSYSGFHDLYPEWIICAEDVIYAWHNGGFYIHNSNTYCNFFGTQYYPSIKLVFNDKVAIKKVFDAIAYQSNQIWVSDTNGDINTSMINPQTGLQQISQLKSVDYEIQENIRYAALLRDADSGSDAQVALLEGDYLNGMWIEVNLRYVGNEYSWIYAPYILWQPSNRNL